MTATAQPKVTLTREIPGIGRLDYEETEKSRAYWLTREGGQRRIRLPSVTTILHDAWAKPWLVDWAGREGANRENIRREAFARGSDTHRFVEHFLLHGKLLGFGEFEPQRRPFLQGAAKFLFEHDPQPEAIEQLICHPEEGYAGRFDLLAVLRGDTQPTLLDFKTSAEGNVYAEAHVQLAGYAVGEQRCSGEVLPKYAVVGIDENGSYRLVQTPVGKAQEAWHDVLRLYRSQKALAKALGESA